MSALDDLRNTVARLRAPDGCPWDREQTHQSLARCLIEETAEVLDTIDRGDHEHMREELGDLLLQVVMHAQLAHERGDFDLEAVASDINAKLIRRHPHVFGEGDDRPDLADAEAVIGKWEAIKAAEKGEQAAEDALFKRLPPQLPALTYACEVFKQIDKKALPTNGEVDRARVEALASGLDEAGVGRRLFELAAACRLAGIDPESACRRHASGVVRDLEKKAHARARQG
jgi:XTP/dITP diphosphohydrolase/tetrapyrrole methylase family protein/MazG family protein